MSMGDAPSKQPNGLPKVLKPMTEPVSCTLVAIGAITGWPARHTHDLIRHAAMDRPSDWQSVDIGSELLQGYPPGDWIKALRDMGYLVQLVPQEAGAQMPTVQEWIASVPDDGLVRLVTCNDAELERGHVFAAEGAWVVEGYTGGLPAFRPQPTAPVNGFHIRHTFVVAPP